MEKIAILMLATAKGSEDGCTLADYDAGETYEVTPALAKTFIDSELAEPADGQVTQKPLASLKVDELRALAEAEGIDLGQATKRAELVDIIEKALAAKANGA